SPSSSEARSISGPSTNYPQVIKYWRSHTAEYVGPVHYVEDLEEVGGGRGFMAASTISPGTILMRERPYIDWPTLPDGIQSDKQRVYHVIRALLQEEARTREQKMENLSHLTPRNLEEVPPGMIPTACKEYEEEIQSLLEEFAPTGITREALILLLLRFQCNGFSSGVYLHLCIFNHACDANCIKFQLRTEEDQRFYSEIRAIAPISQGEELKICYLDPKERPHHERALVLRAQFGFRCACPPC
ncbi:unnamed protein product, partial [Heterosigma akashiwo]